MFHLFLSRIIELKNQRSTYEVEVNYMQQERIFKNGMSQATDFQLAIAEWLAISSQIPINSIMKEKIL